MQIEIRYGGVDGCCCGHAVASRGQLRPRRRLWFNEADLSVNTMNDMQAAAVMQAIMTVDEAVGRGALHDIVMALPQALRSE